MINKHYLLPFNYVQPATATAAAAAAQQRRQQQRCHLNEKTLIVILIISTLITLFVILNNLPAQVNLDDQSIRQMFVPRLRRPDQKYMHKYDDDGREQDDDGEEHHKHSNAMRKAIERDKSRTSQRPLPIPPPPPPIEPPPIEQQPKEPAVSAKTNAERREKIKSVSLLFLYYHWSKMWDILIYLKSRGKKWNWVRKIHKDIHHKKCH